MEATIVIRTEACHDKPLGRGAPIVFLVMGDHEVSIAMLHLFVHLLRKKCMPFRLLNLPLILDLTHAFPGVGTSNEENISTLMRCCVSNRLMSSSITPDQPGVTTVASLSTEELCATSLRYSPALSSPKLGVPSPTHVHHPGPPISCTDDGGADEAERVTPVLTEMDGAAARHASSFVQKCAPPVLLIKCCAWGIKWGCVLTSAAGRTESFTTK